MSGGSMDYLYSRVSDANFRVNTPYRRAFAKHLELVAKALHDIEWVDSGDYGDGDDLDAIMTCIRHQDVLQSSIEDAEKVLAELKTEIERAKTV